MVSSRRSLGEGGSSGRVMVKPGKTRDHERVGHPPIENVGQDIHTQQRLWILVIAMIAGLVVGMNFAHAARPEIPEGDFLSQRYLQILQRTRSPFTAEGSSHTINLVIVRKKEGANEIVPIMNLHEAGPSFRVAQSDKAVLEDSGGLDIGQYVVEILSDKKLRVGFDSFPAQNFIAVSNLQGTIRSASLAGRYLDNEHRVYMFGADGVAKTPGGTFRFTVGIDHVPYQFDYIEQSNTHKIFKFVWKKCDLDIYEVTDAIQNQHGNDGTQVKPWAFLHEIGCKEAH
jgi:hypothetical protein